MSGFPKSRSWAVLVAGALLVAPALAQEPTGTENETASRSSGEGPRGRLFLGFDREAVLADRQWWEGQIEFADYDALDVKQARLVFALQPYSGIEFGGRVGFGDTDTPAGVLDGTGATDLDLWAKFALGSPGGNDLAAGVLATVPTGDDSAGLGSDAFAVGGFFSFRRMIGRMALHADLGLRTQEDGRTLGVRRDGRTSGFVGFGLILPLGDRIDFVGEARFETERFEGADEDARLLGGIDWRFTERSRVRFAAAFGLADGAPDTQILAGYAATF